MSLQQETEFQDIAQKFSNGMKEIIKKYKIKPQYIINVDESPFFWENLPRKVLCDKFGSKAKAFNRAYHHNRSTLFLGCTGAGTMLRPTLILKRAYLYFLQADNDIGLLILNHKTGWMEEINFLIWIEKILFPYVKDNNALLLMDSYESHMSSKVLNHLKKYPNIHVGIIGATTDYCQPLDITVHKEVKESIGKNRLNIRIN